MDLSSLPGNELSLNHYQVAIGKESDRSNIQIFNNIYRHYTNKKYRFAFVLALMMKT